jgi:hypothetical protein
VTKLSSACYALIASQLVLIALEVVFLSAWLVFAAVPMLLTLMLWKAELL